MACECVCVCSLNENPNTSHKALQVRVTISDTSLCLLFTSCAVLLQVVGHVSDLAKIEIAGSQIKCFPSINGYKWFDMAKQEGENTKAAQG